MSFAIPTAVAFTFPLTVCHPRARRGDPSLRSFRTRREGHAAAPDAVRDPDRYARPTPWILAHWIPAPWIPAFCARMAEEKVEASCGCGAEGER